MSHCRSCGGPVRKFLDLGTSPLADAFPQSADEEERRWPLRVGVCGDCWHVQLLDVVPDDLLYGADYGFYTGSSPSSLAYFADYAMWALRRFLRQAQLLTVEIASNDGTLLRHFANAGCRVAGVEPAAGPAQVAQDAGLRTYVTPFGRAAARQVREEMGPAGLVLANNVIAHVADLGDFVGGIADLLAPDGVAVIEAQYVGDLLAGNQWDHVYHEHRSFMSYGSLAHALRPHGLTIRSYGFTPAQGGSIRVVAARGRELGAAILEDEAWLRRYSTFEAVQSRVDRSVERLLDILADERRQGRTLAGYAASAKSTTLLNYAGIGPDLLDHVSDTTPWKLGRVTPGTHIPIVGPKERKADTYLLMAWNYLSGVLRRERTFIDNGGRFIVPIPYPVVL